MPDQETVSVLFETPGPQNTERTLELAAQRARQLGTRHIVVATTSGATGVRAAELMQGLGVVVVSHSTGFKAPNTQELLPEHVERLRALDVPLLTCQHAFGGVARAVRRKLGTYPLDEIVAVVLRMFGQGLKVACLEEIAYTKGYITKAQLQELARPLLKNQYGEYLMTLVERRS